MTISNVDNTTLNNLAPNLDVGDVADPALRLAAFQYIYTYLQTIATDLNALQVAGAIGTNNLANLSVTAAKLANLAVETGKIADLAVTTAKINDLAITVGKIATGAIESTKIADLAIVTSKINDLAITTAKLAAGSVTTEKIADSNVTTAKIATGAVNTSQLADGSVNASKVANGSLTADKFVSGALANETQNGLEIVAIKSDISNLAQNSLSKLSQDMANGLAVTIECKGDSTYYGYLSGVGTQVSNPPPLMLQTVLRTYYNNSNITVINSGVSGNQTTNALRTFESDMAASTAQIVYINYGINDQHGSNPSGVNDPAISAEQYRLNLRSLVTIGRNNGKIMILETPNIQTIRSMNTQQDRMEGVLQFAEVMRQVANELNVPLVDNLLYSQKYLTGVLNVMTAFPDGVHPSQALYNQKALNMAYPLINPNPVILTQGGIIPAGIPPMFGNSPAGNSVVNAGSRAGLFYYSQTSVRLPVWVDAPGLDIYVATAVWSSGSASCNINIDTTTVATISLLESTLTSPNYGADQEILVMQNAAPGLHLIELKNTTGSGEVGLYYVRAHPTRYRKRGFVSAGTTTGGDPTATQRQLVVTDLDITQPSGSSSGHVILDIPVSRTLNTVDVEMTANLSNGDGIVLFMHPISDDGAPHGGLYLYLDGTTGKLTIAEGSGQAGYTSGTVLDATTVYAGTSHRYRITVTPAGSVAVFVDSASIGAYTMTKNYTGGFLGFYKFASGTTRIDKVTLYS